MNTVLWNAKKGKICVCVCVCECVCAHTHAHAQTCVLFFPITGISFKKLHESAAKQSSEYASGSVTQG